MDNDVTLKDVHNAMADVKHPAINCSLIELGMVKDINIKDNSVTFTLLLPFPEVPENIREQMITGLRQSVVSLGLNVEEKIDIMNGDERQYFLTMEAKNWKGL